MTEFEIAVVLEREFRKFGYDIPFDSDTLRIRPGEAVIKGLDRLRLNQIIRDNELDEHKECYKLWGDMSLRDVLADPSGEDQINALQENLKYWYERNLERISQEIT